MLIEIDENEKKSLKLEPFLSYEISEGYGSWIHFIFSDFNANNIDEIKEILGEQNYKHFIIDRIKYSTNYIEWSTLLEFLDDFQIDYDFYIEKTNSKVFHTYSYSETGPMSWEYFEFFCEDETQLKKEMLELILEDIKNFSFSEKLDKKYNLPPQKLVLLKPNGDKINWKYYTDKFPKNLFCISHPFIFGKKHIENNFIYVESNYDFYPFIAKYYFDDFWLFNKMYPNALKSIEFGIKEFDLFIKKLLNEKIQTSYGRVKKSSWLKLQTEYLDSLLLNPHFEIEKTSVDFKNNDNIISIDLFWSKDCDKTYQKVNKHLDFRNSLFNSLFGQPESKGDYFWHRDRHMKNYGDFPRSFIDFFSKENWKLKYTH